MRQVPSAAVLTHSPLLNLGSLSFENVARFGDISRNFGGVTQALAFTEISLQTVTICEWVSSSVGGQQTRIEEEGAEEKHLRLNEKTQVKPGETASVQRLCNKITRSLPYYQLGNNKYLQTGAIN
jgi:hypothetical protein